MVGRSAPHYPQQNEKIMLLYEKYYFVNWRDVFGANPNHGRSSFVRIKEIVKQSQKRSLIRDLLGSVSLLESVIRPGLQYNLLICVRQLFENFEEIQNFWQK